MPALPTDLSPTDLMLAGSVLLAGLAVFLLTRQLFPGRLLQEVADKAAQAEGRLAGGLHGDAPPPARGLRAMGQALVGRLGDVNLRFVKPSFRLKMAPRFVAMGRPEMRPQDFIAQQQLYAVFFFVLGLMTFNLIHKPWWYALPFGLFGAVFPHLWLSDQIKKRQHAIARALPYNIDLLTLSVEAGLDFQAAMGTVVEKGMPGPLLEEMSILLSEIRLGKTRAEALRNMGDRIQLVEVSAFVSNLVQADKMGTSLGKVLRIQSTQMRISRTQRAEKLANEAPLKMLLPLIGCIFPTVFLVLFGPIVYRLMYGG